MSIVESKQVGVGTFCKAPPSIAFVWRSDISRPKDSVSPGISTRHELTDDDVPTFGSDSGAVFKEHPIWSNNVNCTHDLSKQSASFAFNSFSASC
jgi:hypothetical protein